MPKSPKKKENRGTRRYAYIQKQLGKNWRIYKASKQYKTYAAFVNSPIGRTVRDRAALEFDRDIEPIRPPDEQHFGPDGQLDDLEDIELQPFDDELPIGEIPQQDLQEAGPSGTNKRPAPVNPESAHSPSKQLRNEPGNIPVGSDSDTGRESDMAAIPSNVDRARGQTPQNTTSSGGNVPMETESGDGGIGGSSHGGGVSVIPPVLPLRTLHFTIQKKIYRYTYGLKHHEMRYAAGSETNIICTPYAYYPVDWLPWYLTPSEYKSLPFNTQVKMVTSKITLLGTRTAFQHGTSNSGTATTEYIPIAKYAVGLNKRVYLENHVYTCNTNEPMKVDSFTAHKVINQKYKDIYHSIPCATEVPRHINWYASILYNEYQKDKTTYVNGGFNDPMSITGLYRMDKILKTVMVNENLGNPIINYSYSPRCGFVKPNKPALSINFKTANGFERDDCGAIPYNHQVPSYLNVTKEKVSGPHKLNQKLKAWETGFTTQPGGSYFQSIESFCFIEPQTGSVSTFAPQPQIHLGLLGTPSVSPTVDTTDFLNASLYTLSENEIVLEFNHESMVTDGDNPYLWPSDVRFYLDKKRNFTSHGLQQFGVVAHIVGEEVESTSGNFMVESAIENMDINAEQDDDRGDFARDTEYERALFASLRKKKKSG